MPSIKGPDGKWSITGPPKTLNERHKLAALLLATGKTKGWVAKKIGMNANRLGIICGSPLFKTLVHQYQREFISRGMQQTIDKVLADGPANVDFLRDVRDGIEPDVQAIDEPGDRVRHRLAAASMLFDRQLPKRMESESNIGVKITVEGSQRSAAEDACDEVGEPIDITPKKNGQKRLEAPIAPLVARPLDEVIQEYVEREVIDGW